MPYVEPKARKHLDNGIEPLSAGEMNYKITRLIIQYLADKDEELCYDHINEIVGILECAKAEFLIRVAEPYEALKKATNGDVGYCDLMEDVMTSIYTPENEQ